VNAQNEQLVAEIRAYMLEVDSLINCYRHRDSNCRADIEEFHASGFDVIEYSYSKRHNGMGRLAMMGYILDSMAKSENKSRQEIFSNISNREWQEEFDKKVDKYVPTIKTWSSRSKDKNRIGGVKIRKSYSTTEYFQNNKLVAIVKNYNKWKYRVDRETKTLESGKITLYINDDVIIFYEKTGKIKGNRESMAREHNLKL